MKHFHGLLCVMLLITALTVPVWAQAQSISIASVAVKPGPDNSEMVEIQASEPLTPLKHFVLQNPDRVVIDLPTAQSAAIRLPKNYNGNFIRGIRFGQFDATTSRLVIDAKIPVVISEISPGSPLQIVLRAKNGTASTLKGAPAKLLPLVMIDAGHGGQDPGALGLHNTLERDVTLNFARALKQALVATGRYRAALTRDDDRFVTLTGRVEIARKARADILISLHADSNPKPEAQGLSIYTLSATASDAEAQALAEHENKADIITGIDLNTTDADVAGILIDLTQRETMNKSTILADAIVAAMPQAVTLLPKTHRFAGFRVLKAPDVPSVLIELGFLSNANDERLLLTPEYRDQVVGAVVKGIDRSRAR